MNKRLKIVLWILAAAAAAAACGVTLAMMFRKTDSVNRLTPAIVTCAVHEKLDGVDNPASAGIGTEKSDIRIQNTGNISAFLRLRLVSYFVNADGDLLGIASETPAVSPNAGWLAGAENTYYYADPVAPSGQTGSLCPPVTLRQKTLDDGSVAFQVLEVFAEAVQASPAAAAGEAWGVTVSDGKITAAP